MGPDSLILGHREAVIDLGCRASVDPWMALPGALAAAGALLFLVAMGSLIGGAKRWPSVDILVGWGLFTAILTAAGMYSGQPLSLFVLAMGGITLLLVIRRLQKNGPWPVSGWLLVAIGLNLWILIAINLAGVTAWDDFNHWVLNALFPWRFDTLPNRLLPPPYAHFPGYPYAMPFLGYLASLFSNGFLVQGGAMMSWLLLVAFAVALADPALRAPASDARTRLHQAACLVVALLVSTILNPGFNASFSITGQSDSPTAVALGLIGLILVRLHDALKRNDQDETLALTAQFAASGIVLVLLRQVNVILLILITLAFLILAYRDKRLRMASLLLGALVPAIALRFAWQAYIGQSMPHSDFSMLPFADWRWEMMPKILIASGEEMLKKWGFYLLMLGFSVRGLYDLFRPATPARTARSLLAVTFLGYEAFLMLAYIGGSFSEREIERAASFYRYSSHVGLLGMAAIWMTVLPWLERHLKTGKGAAMALCGIALLPAVFALKPDWIVKQARPALCASRKLGRDLAAILPSHAQLAIVDPTGNGLEPYIIHHELALDDARHHSEKYVKITVHAFTNDPLYAVLPRIPNEAGLNAIYVSKPESGLLDPTVQTFFRLPPDAGGTLFMRQDYNTWEKVPFPPQDTPSTR